MRTTRLAIFASTLLPDLVATAETRSSANYSVVAEIADAGGLRATSANYINDGSAGSVTGISTVGAPVEAAKHGYIGQLYDIAGLIVNSAQPSVDEGASLQLGARQILDDATHLAVDAASVAWGAPSAPIASISAGGLATAQIVYENTPASVEGSLGGFTGILNLTVLNVNADDFGSYMGDGIGDDWQVQYFGLDNPNAAPGVDADGDGQDNRFEWTAGLTPTDVGSVFKLRIEAAAAQGALLLFSPIMSGRTYTVTYAHDLLTLPPWPALPGIPPAFDNGPERAVIDIDAHMVPQRFYRVEITKP